MKSRTVSRINFRVLATLNFEVGQPVAIYWGTSDTGNHEFYAGTITNASDHSIEVEMNFGGSEVIKRADFKGVVPLSKPLTKKTVYYKSDVAKVRLKETPESKPTEKVKPKTGEKESTDYNGFYAVIEGKLTLQRMAELNGLPLASDLPIDVVKAIIDQTENLRVQKQAIELLKQVEKIADGRETRLTTRANRYEKEWGKPVAELVQDSLRMTPEEYMKLDRVSVVYYPKLFPFYEDLIKHLKFYVNLHKEDDDAREKMAEVFGFIQDKGLDQDAAQKILKPTIESNLTKHLRSAFNVDASSSNLELWGVESLDDTPLFTEEELEDALDQDLEWSKKERTSDEYLRVKKTIHLADTAFRQAVQQTNLSPFIRYELDFPNVSILLQDVLDKASVQADEKPVSSEYKTLLEALNADAQQALADNLPNARAIGRNVADVQKMANTAIQSGELKYLEKIKNYYPNTLDFVKVQLANKPPVEQDLVKRVDAKYKFRDATISFKEWVADSVDKTDYSPFLSAMKFDNAAREKGLEIMWNDSFPDAKLKPTGDYQGIVVKDFDTLARIVLLDDGKSTVYKGGEGNEVLMVEENGEMYKASLKTDFEESYFNVMEALAKGAVSEGDYTPNPTAIAMTDKAYKFKFATDEFKEAASDSIDKDDYSLFLTAKRFDLVAKKHDCTVDWGYVKDDAVAFGEYNGLIKKRGNILGRIVIGDDGKAPLYIGKSGTNRLTYESGRSIMLNSDAYDREFEDAIVGLINEGGGKKLVDKTDENDFEELTKEYVDGDISGKTLELGLNLEEDTLVDLLLKVPLKLRDETHTSYKDAIRGLAGDLEVAKDKLGKVAGRMSKADLDKANKYNLALMTVYAAEKAWDTPFKGRDQQNIPAGATKKWSPKFEGISLGREAKREFNDKYDLAKRQFIVDYLRDNASGYGLSI